MDEPHKTDSVIDIEKVLASLDDFIFLIDNDYKIIKYWTNDPGKLSIPPRDFLDLPIKDSLGKERAEIYLQVLNRTRKSGEANSLKYKHPERDVYYSLRCNIFIDNGETYFIISVRDITRQHLIEEQKNLFENIVQNNWDAIVFADLTGTVRFVNTAANQLYGYREGELIGENVDVFNSQQSHDTGEIVQAIIDKGGWSGEIIQKKKDGSVFDALLSVQLLKDQKGEPIGYASHSKDITEAINTKSRLKQTIEEKEVLLKELHHRVKNNLAIIQSMIRVQLGDFKNDYDRALMQGYQERIEAIAILHNTLYKATDFNKIELKDYLEGLSTNLVRTYGHKQEHIDFVSNIQPCSVNISIAQPVGLIVNEAITNAFKHAFSEKEKGEIIFNSSFRDRTLTIEVYDNGKGFNINGDLSSTLGLSLIHDLSEQIEGKAEYNMQNGTKFILTVPLPHK